MVNPSPPAQRTYASAPWVGLKRRLYAYMHQSSARFCAEHALSAQSPSGHRQIPITAYAQQQVGRVFNFISDISKSHH